MVATKKKPAAKAKKSAKPTAKKAPAKKAVAAKKTAPKKVAPKKTAVKKPVAKKPAAKKAPGQKAVAPKAAPKKVIAKKPVAHQTAPRQVQPLGIPEQMRDVTLKILNERQAEDIVTISLAGRSSVADYMIIASGRAGRQVSAIADYLREAFHKLGAKHLRIEGLGEANWVLIDGGDVIVHLFRPEVRKYYDLDAIWNSQGPVQK